MSSEIERLAKEAWQKALAQEDGCTAQNLQSRLARFAALIAEACAKECDDYDQRHRLVQNTCQVTACAAAIRAKFAQRDLKDAAK